MPVLYLGEVRTNEIKNIEYTIREIINDLIFK